MDSEKSHRLQIWIQCKINFRTAKFSLYEI